MDVSFDKNETYKGRLIYVRPTETNNAWSFDELKQLKEVRTYLEYYPRATKKDLANFLLDKTSSCGDTKFKKPAYTLSQLQEIANNKGIKNCERMKTGELCEKINYVGEIVLVDRRKSRSYHKYLCDVQEFSQAVIYIPHILDKKTIDFTMCGIKSKKRELNMIYVHRSIGHIFDTKDPHCHKNWDTTTELLGSGSFGSVEKVRLGKRDYALKKSLIDTLESTQIYWNEVSIYAYLNEMNIGISFLMLAAWETEIDGLTYGMILTELGENDFYDELADKEMTLKESFENYRPQINRLLKISQDIGFFHGDLKAANLLVRDGKIYMIDFGWSKIINMRGKGWYGEENGADVFPRYDEVKYPGDIILIPPGFSGTLMDYGYLAWTLYDTYNCVLPFFGAKSKELDIFRLHYGFEEIIMAISDAHSEPKVKVDKFLTRMWNKYKKTLRERRKTRI